jgi:PAS domain S-box-containing protein
VVLTGLDDETIATAALQEGAQDYLVKGQIETRGLLRALRYSVERKVLEGALLAERERVHEALLADIAGRRRAQEALEESEGHYRLLFEGNPHPMYAFDAETLKFLAVNDAAVRHYGYSRAAFLTMVLNDLRRPEDMPVLLRSLAAAEVSPAAGKSLGVFDHRKKSGEMVQMDVAASPIQMGGRRAWLVLAMDVTEKRSLEAQLRQSQKMESIGRLAGGVAHDFNNILGVITGYSELLGRRLVNDPRLHKYVTDIMKAAQRGAGLTRQLLAFSRKQVLQPTILDLNAVVGEMEKMLRRVIGEDVQLLTVFDEALGAVKADAGQMEQVLMNLAVNARDAMLAGGSLTIETGSEVLDEAAARLHPGVEPGRYAVLSVSDTGHGMTAEVQGRIFEPFFTTKPLGKGTGLGLATVHGIVVQSGGHIRFHSAPGEGTTFKIYLPSAEGAGEPAMASLAAADLPPGSETILVVEDEQSMREMIRECLQGTGYTVLEAADGAEAHDVCHGHPGVLDLLITDVVMPGIGGRALAERLQALRPGMRALYISGYTDDAVVLHGVRSAEMAFLQKPFTPQALAVKIRQVLDAPAATPPAAAA